LSAIIEIIPIWVRLIKHAKTTPLPAQIESAIDKVQTHFENLAPGLIKEDKNHLLWMIKSQLFSEIIPILPDNKIPFKAIGIFFEKSVTHATGLINESIEFTTLSMFKNLVNRMEHTPLPNALFCQIAYFLDKRVYALNSEKTLFYKFLDHTKWASPEQLKLSPDIAKAITTMGYMIDNPTKGYDFTKTFCFGILPRLTPAARESFRRGEIIPENDYDYILDLMEDVFVAAFIQLMPPSHHNIPRLLGRVLSHFDTLNSQFQNTLDVNIANVIIETGKTLLQKVRPDRPESYPLIRFCIDGTRPEPEYIPENLSATLATALAKAFLENNQFPQRLGYIFRPQPYSAEIQTMITAHLGQVSPYIPSKIFEKEFRKTTDIHEAVTTLTQMGTRCDDKTRTAHSNAIAKYDITAEASFRLLCAGTAIPTPLIPAAIARGCRDSASLNTLMDQFIAAKTPQKEPLASHLSPLCKAWLNEKNQHSAIWPHYSPPTRHRHQTKTSPWQPCSQESQYPQKSHTR